MHTTREKPFTFTFPSQTFLTTETQNHLLYLSAKLFLFMARFCFCLLLLTSRSSVAFSSLSFNRNALSSNRAKCMSSMSSCNALSQAVRMNLDLLFMLVSNSHSLSAVMIKPWLVGLTLVMVCILNKRLQIYAIARKK